jgi:phenylacetic acid degradation operon negative regulatory protein
VADYPTPRGLEDPSLYLGISGVLRPLTVEQMISTILLDNASAGENALVAMLEAYGVSAQCTTEAIVNLGKSGVIAEQPDGAFIVAGSLQARMERFAALVTRRVVLWDGTWLALRRGDSGRTPESVLARIRFDRFAEIEEGVWTRPDNLVTRGSRLEGLVGTDWSLEEQVVYPNPRAMAGELWDLEGWSSNAQNLLGRAEDFSEDVAKEIIRPELLPYAYLVAAAIFRHLVSDPLLPPALMNSSRYAAELQMRLWRLRSSLHPALTSAYGINYRPLV